GCERWQRVPGLEAALGKLVCRQGHLHGLQTPRPGPKLLRAQLGWNDPDHVSYSCAMGSRFNWTLRTRRTQHLSERRHLAPCWGGEDRARRLRGTQIQRPDGAD